ncbi:MAG TPA: hypothetical protein VID73_00625, partial [Ktedonobacterales bacterium]
EQMPRPDPDQPPIGAVPSRPSVYSEWLNTSLQRPSARSEWLNTPTTAAPDALSLAEAAEAQREAQRQAARSPRRGATNAPGDAPAGPRQRRASQARRLPASDRLASELQAMVEQDERERSGTQAAPPPRRGDRPTDPHGTGFLPTMKIDRTRGTHVLPTFSDDDLRAAAPRPTIAPRQGQPGQGHPGQPRQATGQRPAVQREGMGPPGRGATAGRLPNARPNTAGPRMGTTNGPERGHGVTDPRLAITARETAAPLAGAGRGAGAPVGRGIPVDSGVLIRGARRAPRLSGAIVPKRLRPPSVVTQALVALVTVAVLLGALTVSSPLGYGAAIRGTFQAYANSVAWIPTPTPTATPTPPPAPPSSFANIPASPGQQAIINEIQAVFGQYANGALNIARCESGFVAGATNPYPVGNSHAEGVFQILYPSTWNTTSFAAQNPYNYDANIHAAWEIFSRDGYSWREWECKPY